MKSKASPELPSKMASTQAKIKPELVALYDEYEPALKAFGETIKSKHITAADIYDNPCGDLSLTDFLALTVTPANAEKILTTDLTTAMRLEGMDADETPSLLSLDTKFVEMLQAAFKAIREGMGYTPVDFEGNGSHLNQKTSCPYEMLHAISCNQHFNKIIDHYCSAELKATLTTFVPALNKALEPFVQELHKTVNACEVSYNQEKGLVIKFSSDTIAKKMMEEYTSIPQTKLQPEPLRLEGDNIVVCKQKQPQDIGVNPEAKVLLPSKQARDAFFNLFNGSTGLTSKSDADEKVVYFTADHPGYHNLPAKFTCDMELCGDLLWME